MAQMDVGSKKTGESISEILAERLEKFSVEDVKRKVADTMANKITDQRSELLIKANDVIKKLETDLLKLEKSPDNVIRDLEGKVISSGYSDKKFEELKKLRERVEKATKAFNKAWNSHVEKDYDEVRQLVANQPNKPERTEGDGGDKGKSES